MQEYQRKFIELALKKGVLKFGSFVLKSGSLTSSMLVVSTQVAIWLF